MRMTVHLSLLLSLWAFPHPSADASESRSYVVDSKESKVEFVAIGKPGFLKIKGSGDEVVGEFALEGDTLSGAVSMPLQTLETGMDLRNRHLKEKYLEVEKFTHTKLEIADLKVGPVETEKVIKGSFSGQLDLHGVKRQIEGRHTTRKTGKKIQTEAEFQLTLTDFDIAIPSFSGITVARDVDVKVILVTTEKP